MEETNRFTRLIKILRLNYNLTQANIDELANFTGNKYSRIENGKKKIDLEDIISIGKVYGLNPHEILNPNLKFPDITELPNSTKKLTSNNNPKTLNKKGSWNIPKEIKEVLNTYSIEQTFTNSEIIQQLPKELSLHLNGKSIEWNKGSLRGLVETTNKKRENNIYPEAKQGVEIEYRILKN